MTDSIDSFAHPDDVWLMNMGYVSENSEQNLILYGHLATPGVTNVELMINAEKRLICYAIALNPASYRRYKLQRFLEQKSGLFSKLALLFFLRINGSYDPAARIVRCIRDYAGPSWSTTTEVLNVKQYLKIINSGGSQGWVFKE
jgi:hypothetical protein